MKTASIKRTRREVCDLLPNIFLECWNKNLIEQKEDEKRRKIAFKLRIPYQYISVNTSWKCSSLQSLVIPPSLVDEQTFTKNEMISAETFLQTSVEDSPSFVPWEAKI